MSVLFNNTGLYNSTNYTFVSGGITYRCNKFLNTQTWRSPVTVTASILVVGGGGSGGSGVSGGGGGGGGVLFATASLTSGSLYYITVGQGGIPAFQTESQGANGGTSRISGSGVNLVSLGGGAGGFGPGEYLQFRSNSGSLGASGGGGSGNLVANTPPSAPSGVSREGGLSSGSQGTTGGSGSVVTSFSGPVYIQSFSGGGGGGYSTTGSDSSGSRGANVATTFAGRGGNGFLSTIDGFSRYYGGGGGGGSAELTGSAAGGLGGGGRGADSGSGYTLTFNTSSLLRDGFPGQANTGGGGGGAGYASTGGFPLTFSRMYGGSGGSGIVIVTYRI
jgi:hypothetical protein